MTAPQDTITRLYDLLAARDATGVQALVDQSFAEDVVLHEPPSLPWGGAHSGRKRVGRLFVGMAAAEPGTSPLDAASLVVRRVAGSDSEVAVEVGFMLTRPGGEPEPSGAVEWFSFRDGRVCEIRATYFEPGVS